MKALGKKFFGLDVIGIGLLLVVIFVLPQVAGLFWQYLVCLFFVLGLFSLSFNLLFGMTGYLPFGHMAFYATGAYVTGLLMIAGVPLLPAVLLGTVAAVVLALLLGIFCVRYTFVYFSLLSLSFGMMIHAIIWKWSAVTGGDDGLVGIPRGSLEIPGIINIPLDTISQYYYFHAVICLIAMYIIYRICKSPFGLVLNGMRDNIGRVEFAGLPTRRYLLYVYALAGLFAGLAGSLLAPLEKTVSPVVANWPQGAEPLIATLIGGPWSFWGPIVGSVVYIGLKEIIVRFTSYWLLILGIMVVALVMGFRGGIMGFMQDWLSKRAKQSASALENKYEEKNVNPD